ncbi:hypothetical protein BASA81_012410 [Batrachochytrium salamandrivorans]|nr:hypothetical protein BASA81_012410 [Batrachochytrium salamandrivorans]
MNNKALVVATGVLVAYALVDTFKPRASKPPRPPKDDADGKKPRKSSSKKGDPMARIFWLLFPFFRPANAKLGRFSNAASGKAELVLIFIVSCLRTWHSDRMVYVKRDLMAATYLRDVGKFKQVMLSTLFYSFVSSLIFSLHRYLKDRLTLVWRVQLTRQLHERFFFDHGYYKISHLNENAIPDVEERITRDPRRFAKGLADEMEKLSAAMTSGLWFTYRLTQITSLPYALSPLAYFFVAFQVAIRISPDWGKRWREMLDMKGYYEKLHTRIQTHAEAIAAYQGNDQERAIIDTQWTAFLQYCKVFVNDAALFTFVTSAFFEYGGHSFAEALIVGRFVSATAPGKEQLANATTAKEIKHAQAALFSKVRFLTEYFIRTMSAQGTIIAVMRQLQNMRSPAKRLTELFDTLEDFENKKIASTTFKEDSDRIAFENCQIFTPTGHLLVKDLNFEIHTGQSMLLTGCNGSGKSSLFRCLGGLWEMKEGGTITKPFGDSDGLGGLNKAVFYLPQRPYSVLGTLRDQLSYPAPQEESAKISDELLKELLDEVDLGYLLDRPQKEDDTNWEDILSLGEKQRLAAARLFYHSPKFAVLDECTSGVSAAMERRLYETCVRRGITCITISHRPVLEQYHDVVLNILADGKGGWEWRKTRKDLAGKEDGGAGQLGGYSESYLKQASSTAGEGKAGSALKERLLLKERSADYLAKAAGLEREIAPRTTWQRLQDVVNKFQPDGFSLGDSETLRILKLVGMIVMKTVLADAIARYDGFIISTVLTSPIFYDVKNLDNRIADPDERITEQVEELSIALTDLWTALLKPAFDIAFNTVMLYRALGVQGVALTSGYMVIGTLLMRFVIPNFRALKRQEFDLEGRFRFVHTRLSVHTESVAFFGGDQVEHDICEKRLGKLAEHIESSQIQSLKFNFFSNFSIKQTPDLIAFSLRMAHAMRNPGEEISSQGEYIQQTVMRSFSSFGDAFDLQETLGQFVGVLEQVTDFMYVLQDLHEQRERENSNRLLASADNQSICFDGVDIVTPGQLCIAKSLSFTVQSGKSLLVTGANASGKSSLFRTLGGLWPIPEGRIYRPVDPQSRTLTPKQVFLVPQKPYSVLGTLADQITYPVHLKQRTQQDEDKLFALLELVRVSYLVGREKGGWDAKSKWEDTLSLGEQQRIGMARMYYHQPMFTILDECTSAVSIDVEKALYNASFERGITSITISQRLALQEFHSQELMFGDEQGESGWKLRDI